MSQRIHPTAILGPDVVCEEDVEIGPYCVLDGHIRIGRGTRLASHVVFSGHVEIGREGSVQSFTAIGGPPQDKSYKGEPTRVEIGDQADIREHVTIHRASTKEDGVTRIGHNCMLMSTVHVGHDCRIGNDTILSSGVALGGHVRIDDRVIIGGNTAVHQFVHLGEGAMIGGQAAIDRDVIPYGLAYNERASLEGLNIVGLRRSGMSRDDLRHIRQVFDALFGHHSDLSFEERRKQLDAQEHAHPVVTSILEFIGQDRRRPLTHPDR